ncbi:hypothetical protein C8T65DRAFT_740383 [Cerioporus squamosus]|nr:hypothetical protein C8T65DRAFT_740383 [Cerioporus squamosus]
MGTSLVVSPMDKTLSPSTELRCPGFVINIVPEDGSDLVDDSELRVDALLISVDDSKNLCIKPNELNWSVQRLPIESMGGGATYDPFDDNPKHKPEHEVDSAADCRGVYGQLMTYAERVPEFCVMSFDHGGVITTEARAIDYISFVEGTATLLAFLHAFSKLDDCRQGIDTTAILLPPESCSYKRMHALKDARPDDLAHHARYVDDANTSPREPSPATVAKAKSLEKHSSVRSLLQKYLNKSRLPADDTVRDRLAKINPLPRRESLSDIEDTSAPKKVRTDTGPKPSAAASSSNNRGCKATGSDLARQKTHGSPVGSCWAITVPQRRQADLLPVALETQRVV